MLFVIKHAVLSFAFICRFDMHLSDLHPNKWTVELDEVKSRVLLVTSRILPLVWYQVLNLWVCFSQLGVCLNVVWGSHCSVFFLRLPLETSCSALLKLRCPLFVTFSWSNNIPVVLHLQHARWCSFSKFVLYRSALLFFLLKIATTSTFP